MPAGALLFWEAWHVLRNDRHVGAMGGVGPIFYTAMSTYAADHGIRGASFEALRIVVRAMDDVYLAWAAEEAKKAAENRQQ